MSASVPSFIVMVMGATGRQFVQLVMMLASGAFDQLAPASPASTSPGSKLDGVKLEHAGVRVRDERDASGGARRSSSRPWSRPSNRPRHPPGRSARRRRCRA